MRPSRLGPVARAMLARLRERPATLPELAESAQVTNVRAKVVICRLVMLGYAVATGRRLNKPGGTHRWLTSYGLGARVPLAHSMPEPRALHFAAELARAIGLPERPLEIPRTHVRRVHGINIHEIAERRSTPTPACARLA